MFVSCAHIHFHSAMIEQKFRGGALIPTMVKVYIQGNWGLLWSTTFVCRNVLTYLRSHSAGFRQDHIFLFLQYFLFLQHLSARWFRRRKSPSFSWHAQYYCFLSNQLWANRMHCDGARETAVYRTIMRQKTHETGEDNRRTNENITVCLHPLWSLNIRLHGVVITSMDRSLPFCLFASLFCLNYNRLAFSSFSTYLFTVAINRTVITLADNGVSVTSWRK